mmetsp:Transcript_23883/g.68950  ORF Transcript_23883/g.68950 Transcript_23883/m.68950 type:complete len:1116 (+) Transcript_23883:1-3348(+)
MQPPQQQQQPQQQQEQVVEVVFADGPREKEKLPEEPQEKKVTPILQPPGPMCTEAMKFGWKLPNKEDILAMMLDFVLEYEQEEFQSELRALPPGAEGITGKDELLWSCRRTVLVKYSFPPDMFGLQMIGEFYALFAKDQEVKALNRRMFLALDPKMQDKVRGQEKEQKKREAQWQKENMSAEEKARRQHAMEQKAIKMSKQTKEVALSSQKILENPTKYTVVSNAAYVYSEPHPKGQKTEWAIEKGTVIYGYPGSMTWIKVDATASGLEELNPEAGNWVPMKSWEAGEDVGNVLVAHWQEIRLVKNKGETIELAWPGLAKPADEFMVQYTVEWKEDRDDDEKGRKGQGLSPRARIELINLPVNADVQVRLKAKVDSNERSSGQVVLIGDWKSIHTADLAALADADADAAEEEEWEVVEPMVLVVPKADAKQTAKQAVDRKAKGEIIKGIATEVDGFLWLQTKHEDKEAWVLIDGAAANLKRMFLRRVDTAGFDPEGIYEVTERELQLYSDPREDAEPPKMLETLKKGTRVYAVPHLIIREMWLRITDQRVPPPVNVEIEPCDSVWALAPGLRRLGDGSPQGRAVKQSRDGGWQVLYRSVMLRAKPSWTAKTVGSLLGGSLVMGEVEEVEGVEWLRVVDTEKEDKESWICLDASTWGLDRPLVKKLPKKVVADEKDIALWKAQIARPMPPRPLTVPWMAAYSGLEHSCYTVREELLPEQDDVGMNSQCTLVYITPNGGGSELGYVSKRATVNDDLATKDTAELEYRFYAEMIFPPPGQSQPPPGVPVMLADAIRVPRCQVVNYRVQKTAAEEEQEAEEEAEGTKPKKSARSQYFLLMEMLGPPNWVYPNPAAGLSHEQAKAAARALGNMHNGFDKPGVMEKLSWLQLTVFNIGEGDAGIKQREEIHEEFSNKVNLERAFVQQALSAGAFEAVDRMCSGGLVEVCEKLAEPPLTFCHGDFRTENIRFQNVETNPEVATFDFGLSCRATPGYDLSYFIMLSMPPHARRAREIELLSIYLAARGVEVTEKSMGELFEKVKLGSLGVLALTLTTRLAARKSGFYAETRETQRRMLRWVGQAVEDWAAYDVLREPTQKSAGAAAIAEGESPAEGGEWPAEG